MVGSSLGAKRGILFKDAAAIEAAARVQVVAFHRRRQSHQIVLRPAVSLHFGHLRSV